MTSGLGVWEEEIATHCPVPWRTVSPEGEVLGEGGGEGERLEFMIVHFAGVYSRAKIDRTSWAPMPRKTLVDFKADLVVVDEGHHVGNPTAVQSQMCRKLGREAKYRLIMTGSMFHRKPFFTFGQALFYDDGATFGSDWTQFKKRIAVFGGFGGYQILRYRNLGWMIRQLESWVFMQKYVPPRNTAVNTLYFHLEDENLHQYVEMAKEGVVTARGETIMSEIILSKHLRLQQICGGWLKGEEKYVRVGDSKLKILQDRLNEYMEQGITKAVIGCRFIPEIADIARAAKKAGYKVILFHGGIPKGKPRTERVKRFKETKEPTIFVSQIQAGKESINLSAADTMLFYSLSESYVEHDQFSKRIELYNEKRTLMYDFLVARGTRDEVTFEAIQLKKDVADFIVEDPERVERIARVEV